MVQDREKVRGIGANQAVLENDRVDHGEEAIIEPILPLFVQSTAVILGSASKRRVSAGADDVVGARTCELLLIPWCPTDAHVEARSRGSSGNSGSHAVENKEKKLRPNHCDVDNGDRAGYCFSWSRVQRMRAAMPSEGPESAVFWGCLCARSA